MPQWATCALAFAVAAFGPACSCGDDLPATDAAVGHDGDYALDASIGPDAVAPLNWIDFAVTGCEAGSEVAGPGVDAGAGSPDAGPVEPCLGAAPLHLEFVPITPGPVELYEWNFGDGSEPDTRALPDHVFAQPGAYDVSLSVQGPGGTAGVTKSALIVVGPASLGAACDADEECASASCVCADGSCDGFAHGFCSATCSPVTPCASGACADLAPGSPALPDDSQTSLCLPDCSGGGACPDGSVCRELLRGDDDGWVSACFAPGHLADLGESCADDDGVKRDELCAGGLCLDEGVRGLCSAPCADAPCPASSACATFVGGLPAPSCLARCDAETLCDGDPWLSCADSGGAASKNFAVDEDGFEYCAPTPCDEPSDCEPLGTCVAGSCSLG